MQTRIDRLREHFPDADAVLVTSYVSRFWASGFAASAGAVIVTKKTAHFIADSRYIEAVTARVTSMTSIPMEGLVEEETAKLIRTLGAKRVAFEDCAMTVAEFAGFQKAMPEVEFVPLGETIARLRAVKDETEVAYVRRAQDITERSFAQLLPYIKVGVTEREIAKRLEILMLENGSDGPAFETICVGGPNASMPHGVPGERPLADGDFLTMDFGATWRGYKSDMTRTVAIGHVTDEMRRVYDTVLAAQEAAIAAVKAGVIGRDIDKVARDLIGEAGYGGNFGHGLGHSFGIEIHENPRFSPRCTDAVPAGCLITVEPGVYLPGKFGVRIEDDLLVTEAGCENLTHAPKALLVL
ncbi:MAG TPA: aminopeptidase P family protein [Terriglobales bacterium]|nr:aminopeptidase P family protein [Terriglobales bacterium]